MTKFSQYTEGFLDKTSRQVSFLGPLESFLLTVRCSLYQHIVTESDLGSR